MGTRIEWTNETWNPIIGCTKISEGCKNCYAEKFAHRLAHIGATQNAYSIVSRNGKWSGHTIMIQDQLMKPFSWKNPRMVFVCSMGDLFHESVPFEWIDEVINVIRWTTQHTYQLLTKRPYRMLEYFTEHIPKNYLLENGNFLDNLWLGVTAENQEQADERIPILLKIPAKVRFVSVEPILSAVQFTHFVDNKNCDKCDGSGTIPLEDGGKACPKCLNWSNGNGYLPDSKIDWVIAGPETGPGKREYKIEWIKSLYMQCAMSDVYFFDKRNVLGKNIQEIPEKL